MSFIEVTVAIKTETTSKKGTGVKVIKEVYLVDAMSCTEAEARVVEDFKKSGFSQDFRVIGVRESKVVGIIYADDKKK